MKVYELILALNDMPQDLDVRFLYDGALRGEVEAVWLARRGVVALGDTSDCVYEAEDCPDTTILGEIWGVER